MTRIAEEAWRVRIMKQERIRSKRRRLRAFRLKLQIRIRRKICDWLENAGPQQLKRKLITDVKEIAAGVAFASIRLTAEFFYFIRLLPVISAG